MEKVRYGIVGVGTMGRTHAVKFMDGKVANSTLGAVCDIDPEKREWCKKNLKDVPCFDTAEEMFASGTCDAVVIAIPHYDHPTYAIKALEAGLHVMTEKPAGKLTIRYRTNEYGAYNQKYILYYAESDNVLAWIAKYAKGIIPT